MINELKKVTKFKSTFAAIILSSLSVTMLSVRIAAVKSGAYVFLFWNLFLAFVPWFLACVMYTVRRKSRLLSGILFFFWLIFFPNAPYIFTDMIHLGSSPHVPVIFDFILLSCFGLSGMLFAYTGLLIIERIILESGRPRMAMTFSLLMLYLSSLGIYLGRFLRWNSWDILTNPGSVLSDALRHLFHPENSTRTWFLILTAGTLLSFFYLLFRKIGKKEFERNPVPTSWKIFNPKQN